jgi:hypothetical protein
MSEIQWRDIPGQPGYQASACGQIRSLERRIVFKDGRSRVFPSVILRQSNHSAGYLNVGLGANNSRTAHTLVAAAFLGERENMWVNHKNGNKKDNRIENLEWVSPSDNQRHAVATGLSPKPPLKRGTDQHKARLDEEKVREIRGQYENGAGIARLAKEYGVGESTIRNVVRRNSWAWLD